MQNIDQRILNRLPKKLRVPELTALYKEKTFVHGIVYTACLVWEDGFDRCIIGYGFDNFLDYYRHVVLVDREYHE